MERDHAASEKRGGPRIESALYLVTMLCRTMRATTAPPSVTAHATCPMGGRSVVQLATRIARLVREEHEVEPLRAIDLLLERRELRVRDRRTDAVPAWRRIVGGHGNGIAGGVVGPQWRGKQDDAAIFLAFAAVAWVSLERAVSLAARRSTRPLRR